MRRIAFLALLLCGLRAPIRPSWYLVAGPFPVGSREGLVFPLRFYGTPATLRPREGQPVPSWMVPGAEVRWRRVEAKEGKLEIQWKEADLEAIQDHWGWAGLIYVGYAYTEIQVPEQGWALLQAEKALRVWLNGRPYVADIYGHGYLQVPVPLKEGTNRVLVAFTRWEPAGFRLALLPVESPLVILERDIRGAEAVLGRPLEGGIAVPVVNATQQWVRGLRVHIEVEVSGKRYSATAEGYDLPPGGMDKVPIPYPETPALTEQDLKEEKLPMRIRVEAEGLPRSEVDYLLPARKPEEPYRVSFVSAIDRSLQTYAVREPTAVRDRYALILTLHGAGVEDLGQARAYQPKEWAYIVAPRNRRRFGFDWQDWGRLDALEALHDALKRFPIDSQRVILTGHSMGGHGTWHVGTRHPDLFTAIVPNAGWIDFRTYVPFFLRRSHLFGTPDLMRVLWRSLRSEMTVPFLENLRGLRVFVRQGGADQSVPPVHARLLVGFAREAGVDATYREYEGASHWWNLPETPETDAVEDAELWKAVGGLRKPEIPRAFTYQVTDLADNPRIYFLTLRQPRDWNREVRVEFQRKGKTFRLRTWNLRELEWDTRAFPDDARLFVDDQEVPLQKPRLVLSWAGQWKTEPLTLPPLHKRPDLTGPIKRAYYAPFLLVYADEGPSERTALYRHLAVQQAYHWYHRADGRAPVRPASEITEEELRNWNLILYGTPQDAGLVARLLSEVPFVEVRKNGIRWGETLYSGYGPLGLQFVYPIVLNGQPTGRLVVFVTGTDAEGVALAAEVQPVYSGALVPDFVLVTRKLRAAAWAGFLCAGFFGNDWSLKGGLSYCAEGPPRASPWLP